MSDEHLDLGEDDDAGGDEAYSNSLKTAVVERLYKMWRADPDSVPRGIVRSELLRAVMVEVSPGLSTANPANFLKDIVRSKNANDWWPQLLKNDRIRARQVLGKKRVFMFWDYIPGTDIPFPDRFIPQEDTPVLDLPSVSMPFLARSMGRREETWLTQVAVNLRLVESHLSLVSHFSGRIRDLTHLQMGMKTQPEIDATYLLTLNSKEGSLQESVLLTVEAKTIKQRLLEDQIREQVKKAMAVTKKLKPPIHAVLPIAIQVIKRNLADGKSETLIFLVEFGSVERAAFEQQFADTKDDDLRHFNMPLESACQSLFRISPAIKGLA